MSSISTEAKVGIFVLAAMVILGYMSFRVGEYGFALRKGYPVKVVFDNVTGLERDAAVQIAGVEVGRVEDIVLKDGKAVVTLRIIPTVKLQRDAVASLKTHGILGDKYVDIRPGTEEYGYIPEGGEIYYVEKTADLDEMLRELGTITNDVMAVTASLKGVLGDEEGEMNLRAIVENTRDLTMNLNRVIERGDRNLTELAESLTETSQEIKRAFVALAEVSERVNRGEGTLGQLVENRQLYDNLAVAAASLQDIADQIRSGEGTIGKLIYEDETAENINRGLTSIERSMEGINRYVSKSEQFRTFITYRGEYLAETDNAKSYFNVRLQPREDMFYILGVVADPRGKRTTKHYYDYAGRSYYYDEYEKDTLLFDAQIGKRFKDVAVRGGIFESSGGVGFDYFAFDDSLKLTFEAFDFEEDRRTHLKAYVDYRLFSNLYLTAGWDDFISDHGNSSVFAGFSIHFEDRDLKYLLSSVPTP